MINILKSLTIYFLSICLLLTACESRNGKNVNNVKYNLKEEIINLNIEKIEVVDNASPGLIDEANLFSTLKVSPRTLIKSWIKNHLRSKNEAKISNNNAMILKIFLNDASIHTKYNENTNTKEYEARYLIKIHLLNNDNYILNEFNISSNSKKNIIGNILIDERDEMLSQIMHELLDKTANRIKHDLNLLAIN